MQQIVRATTLRPLHHNHCFYSAKNIANPLSVANTLPNQLQNTHQTYTNSTTLVATNRAYSIQHHTSTTFVAILSKDAVCTPTIAQFSFSHPNM
jgi:hypothetical protein